MAVKSQVNKLRLMMSEDLGEGKVKTTTRTIANLSNSASDESCMTVGNLICGLLKGETKAIYQVIEKELGA